MERDPRQRFGMRTTGKDTTNMILLGVLAAACVGLLAFMFTTGDNKTGVATSDTSTRVERNAPADKPKTDLNTATPTKPAK